MYEIAQRFSEGARRIAAQRTYDSRLKHDANGRCPLGICLAIDFHRPDVTTPSHLAVARIIADRPIDTSGTFLAQRAIREAARVFIRDWDHGRITDLAEALGVTL